MIKQCEVYSFRNRGGIGYITIQESVVEAGKTQRRAGLHTDGCSDHREGGTYVYWGRQGGIFFASNVEESCVAWNCTVPRTGPHGDCEHLRKIIEAAPRTVMEANTMYIINDTTPHEALPMKESTPRQFFRLVLGEVSHWFSKNSTPNPLGVVPPSKCTIVTTDKFETWTPLLHGIFPRALRMTIAALMAGMQRLQDEGKVACVDPAAFEETVRYLRYCD